MADGPDGSDADHALLLVEDDERIASFLRRGFGAKGFSVEWVERGADAVSALERTPFAAVVLDLGLPDIDGLELLAAWQSAESRVPVVVLTARSDPRDRDRALSLGAVAYLTKPTPFVELVAAVEAAIHAGR